ncbi:MAG: hypothetical protein Q9195_003677 [Heterodermia aff. obscurata]
MIVRSQLKTPSDIEIATLSNEDLDRLAKATRVMLNTIGPYHLYSTPIVESCARNGTHYLDVTGETAWVLQIIENYHNLASVNGAIIIPEIGLESAPSDLLAWSLATYLKRTLTCDTAEVVCTVHEVRSRPSGGTLATILSTLDAYSLKEIGRANKPWAMSPIPGPRSRSLEPLFTRLFGVRVVNGLGTMTTSIAGSSNRAIVQRSWGLLDKGKYYGPNFQYSEYLSVRNTLFGIAVHFAFALGSLLLLLRPIRWLMKRLVYAPGEGRSKIDTKEEVFEFRAIATADEAGRPQRRAFARFRWDGGAYYLTGVFLAEAAMVILQDSKIVEKTGGGILTPATLGQPFIDRLCEAGVEFKTESAPPRQSSVLDTKLEISSLNRGNLLSLGFQNKSIFTLFSLIPLLKTEPIRGFFALRAGLIIGDSNPSPQGISLHVSKIPKFLIDISFSPDENVI